MSPRPLPHSTLRRARGLLAVALASLALGCGPGPSLWKQLTLVAPGSAARHFREMDRIFPARTVHRGGPVFAFARADDARTASLGAETGTTALLGSEDEHFLARTRTTGLLIVQQDTVLLQRGFDGATADARFTSWSVAKSVVSALVGVALAEGAIRDLDDPVDAYVPWLGETAYQGVSLRDVLVMASGVRFSEDYDSLFSDIRRTFYRMIFAGGRVHDAVRTRLVAGPAGVESRYRSVDTEVLGLVVEAATGERLASLLERAIWRPLGMEADAYWNLDREGDDGREIAFCCLSARLADYARFVRLYLHDGEWNGRRVLPREYVRESLSTSRPFQRAGQVPGSPFGYGHQWWLPAGDEGEFLAIGVYGQALYGNRARDLVIVRTAADPSHRMDETESLAFFRRIAERAQREDGDARVASMR